MSFGLLAKSYGHYEIILAFLKDQKRYESEREPKEELRLSFVCKNCTVMTSSLCVFGNDLQMHGIFLKHFVL